MYVCMYVSKYLNGCTMNIYGKDEQKPEIKAKIQRKQMCVALIEQHITFSLLLLLSV